MSKWHLSRGAHEQGARISFVKAILEDYPEEVTSEYGQRLSRMFLYVK